MIEDTGDLAKHGPDTFSAFRHLHVEQSLEDKRIAVFVCHWEREVGRSDRCRGRGRTHVNIAQAVKIGQCLDVLGELFCPPVKKTDVLLDGQR
jgi:hypothetical protein